MSRNKGKSTQKISSHSILRVRIDAPLVSATPGFSIGIEGAKLASRSLKAFTSQVKFAGGFKASSRIGFEQGCIVLDLHPGAAQNNSLGDSATLDSSLRSLSRNMANVLTASGDGNSGLHESFDSIPDHSRPDLTSSKCSSKISASPGFRVRIDGMDWISFPKLSKTKTAKKAKHVDINVDEIRSRMLIHTAEDIFLSDSTDLSRIAVGDWFEAPADVPSISLARARSYHVITPIIANLDLFAPNVDIDGPDDEGG